MNNDELFVRQKHLVVRSAQLRVLLADQAQVLQKPLARADQAQSGLQWLYRNPLWPLGALVLVALVRPRRAVALSGRLWWAWKAFKQTQKWLVKRPLQKQLP